MNKTKSVLIFLTLSLTVTFGFAANCPSQPNTPGWMNPYSLNSGTWTKAAWKQSQGGVMYCYYKSSLPFSEFIYKTGITKPTSSNWTYDPASQTLQCNSGLTQCTF